MLMSQQAKILSFALSVVLILAHGSVIALPAACQEQSGQDKAAASGNESGNVARDRCKVRGNSVVEGGKQPAGGYYDSLLQKGQDKTAAQGYYATTGASGKTAPDSGGGKDSRASGYYATIGPPPAPGQGCEDSGKANGPASGGAAGYYATIGPAAQPSPPVKDGYYSTIPPVKDDGTEAVAVPVKSGAPQPSSVSNSTLGSGRAGSQGAMNVASPTAPVALKPAPLLSTVTKPTVASAVKAFNERRFGEALSQFDKLDHSGYCCDTVHYYLARCYQQLSQVAAAQQNYELVMTNSRNPTLRAYSQMAYDQLTHYSQHRTYEGNGNNFSRMRGGWGRGGGGG